MLLFLAAKNRQLTVFVHNRINNVLIRVVSFNG
jgi:hypothetical protein